MIIAAFANILHYKNNLNVSYYYAYSYKGKLIKLSYLYNGNIKLIIDLSFNYHVTFRGFSAVLQLIFTLKKVIILLTYLKMQTRFTAQIYSK